MLTITISPAWRGLVGVLSVVPIGASGQGAARVKGCGPLARMRGMRGMRWRGQGAGTGQSGRLGRIEWDLGRHGIGKGKPLGASVSP